MGGMHGGGHAGHGGHGAHGAHNPGGGGSLRESLRAANHQKKLSQLSYKRDIRSKTCLNFF
jgi:hypothetical protein